MLTTRLWMGAILVALTAAMLVADQYLAPIYPFQFVFVVGLGLLACRELIQLLGPNRQPHSDLCFGGIMTTGTVYLIAQLPWKYSASFSWLELILGFLFLQLLILFVVEMVTFKGAGRCVERIALTLWIIVYLGVAPCFLMQLRSSFGPEEFESVKHAGTMALALAIFVPKLGDIGAYSTGRLIGSHRMAPVLSPKKTWEGAAGGLLFASLTAIAINRLGPINVLPPSLGIEVGFGLTVGIVGILGDLAESLIKRDCQQKDASQVVPGFGGVLDVVDSVIFSAPVSYFFFKAFSEARVAV